jgi:hypothetical protein
VENDEEMVGSDYSDKDSYIEKYGNKLSDSDNKENKVNNSNIQNKILNKNNKNIII